MGREYAGRLKVIRRSIDEAPAVAASYGVQGIQLLIVMKNGQEADRLVGAAPPARLREMIERHVTAVAEPPGCRGSAAPECPRHEPVVAGRAREPARGLSAMHFICAVRSPSRAAPPACFRRL